MSRCARTRHRKLIEKQHVFNKYATEANYSTIGYMGVGRIFSRGGGSREFSQKFFQGGAKSGEICFLPLENEKTTFFC